MKQKFTSVLSWLGLGILALHLVGCTKNPSELPKAKYARCAGSYELEKCNAIEEALTKETPDQVAARKLRLEQDRQKAMKEIDAEPIPATQPAAVIVDDSPKGTAKGATGRQWFVFDVNKFESNVSPADRMREIQSWGEYAKAEEKADGTVEVGHETPKGYEYWTFFRTLASCKAYLPKSQAIPSSFE